MEKICKGCGVSFERKVNSQKYCSRDCRSIYGKNPNKLKPECKTCVGCGELFESKHNSQRYCSPECQSINGKGKTHKNKPDGYVYHGVCRYCGKEFESPRKRIYCSEDCMKQKYSDDGKKARRPGGIKCKHCGEIIPRTRLYFCNDECKHEYYRKTDIVPLTDTILSVRIAERYDHIEYVNTVSGRNGGRDGTLTVRCKVCGGEFQIGERASRKTTKASCPHCAEPERLKRQEEQEHRKAKRNCVCSVCGRSFVGRPSAFCSIDCRKEGARRYSKALEKERYDQCKVAKQCKYCGEMFTPEYGRCGKVYCSEECAKKAANKRKGIKRYERRARKNGNGDIDHDISLDKLIKRDKNICHICGGKCSKRDHRIDENVNFIAGASYPSIDHIQPLSKGGAHAWSNVKLAHCRCNSIKRDLICFEKPNGQMMLAV